MGPIFRSVSAARSVFGSARGKAPAARFRISETRAPFRSADPCRALANRLPGHAAKYGSWSPLRRYRVISFGTDGVLVRSLRTHNSESESANYLRHFISPLKQGPYLSPRNLRNGPIEESHVRFLVQARRIDDTIGGDVMGPKGKGPHLSPAVIG